MENLKRPAGKQAMATAYRGVVHVISYGQRREVKDRIALLSRRLTLHFRNQTFVYVPLQRQPMFNTQSTQIQPTQFVGQQGRHVSSYSAIYTSTKFKSQHGRILCRPPRTSNFAAVFFF